MVLDEDEDKGKLNNEQNQFPSSPTSQSSKKGPETTTEARLTMGAVHFDFSL